MSAFFRFSPWVLAGLLVLAACAPSGEDAGGDRASDDAAAAAAALAAFGLAEQGRAIWAERRFEDGAYHFDALVITDADGVFRAAELVLTAPRLEDDAPRFDRLELVQIEMTSETGEARLDGVLIDGPGPGLAEDVAAAFAGRERSTADRPAAEERFDAVRLSGLSAAVEETTGAPVRFSVASVIAEGFDGARLDRLDISEVALNSESVEAGPLDLRLERAAFTGLESRVLDLAALEPASSRAAAPFAATGPYERFELNGFSLLISGVRLTMPAMTGAVVEEAGGVLRSTVRMERLSLEPEDAAGNGAAFARTLAMLGYDRFDFSLSGDSVYAPAQDRARTVGENYLDLADGFRLLIDQDISGLEAYAAAYADFLETAGPENAGSPPPELFSALRLHRFQLRLEDRSLLDRAIAAFAETQGATSEAVRQQAGMLALFGLSLSGGVLPADLLTQSSAAMTQFIAEGGALVIELNPPEPAPVSLFMNGGAYDADAIGLSVRREPPPQVGIDGP